MTFIFLWIEPAIQRTAMLVGLFLLLSCQQEPVEHTGTGQPVAAVLPTLDIALEETRLNDQWSLFNYRIFKMKQGKIDGLLEEDSTIVSIYQSFLASRTDTVYIHELMKDVSRLPYNYLLHEVTIREGLPDTLYLTLTHDCEACYHRLLYDFIGFNDTWMYQGERMYPLE